MNKPRTRIVCIGEDSCLLDNRRLLLEEVGYNVVTVRPRYLSSFRAISTMALVIICHSVYEPERAQLVAWVRQNFPLAPILLLSRGGESKQPYMGYPVSGTWPEELLQSIESLIPQTLPQS